MQIVDALKSARQQLKSSDTAGFDAELLLCSILKCDRAKLYSHPERELTNNDSESFNKLIAQRSEGRPVAHLINKKEFWSLELTITTDTLIPRPETEVLVETALMLISNDGPVKILDLGTGSGAIALALASEHPLADITATDINKNALKTAQENATAHDIRNITFTFADWFAMKTNYSYDLIVSNPPYICNDDPHLKQGDVQFEPTSALVSGEDGLDDLKIIIQESCNYLNSNGWLVVEHGYNQGKAVRQLFVDNDFTSTSTSKDYNGNERVSIGQLIY